MSEWESLLPNIQMISCSKSVCRFSHNIRNILQRNKCHVIYIFDNVLHFIDLKMIDDEKNDLLLIFRIAACCFDDCSAGFEGFRQGCGDRFRLIRYDHGAYGSVKALHNIVHRAGPDEIRHDGIER